jgi:AcrR family transcriptional regulator
MKSTRPYESALRERQAASTRQEILRAARVLFARDGYVATPVSRVAKEAGVSAQTVYARFESKAGLARALIGYTNEESGARILAKDVAAAPTPRAMLRASVHLVCVLHERIGDLIRVLLEAAQADASLAPAIAAGHASHAGPQHGLAARLAAAGALRQGLTADDAAGLLTVMTSPDTVERYVTDLGWDYERIESVLAASVTDAICDPDRADQPWPADGPSRRSS